MIGQAEDLRGVECDRFQGFVVGQAVRYGVGGLLAQATGERVVEAAKRDFDAGVGEFGGLSERAVVGIVFVERLGERWAAG